MTTEIAEKEIREQLEKEYETKLLAKISDLEDEYKAKRTKDIAEIRQRLDEQNREILNTEIERLQREMKPPTEDDIQALLSQEYVTFNIKLPFNGEERTFTITELPQELESKFFDIIKNNLRPRAEQLSALTSGLLEGNIQEKIDAMIGIFDPFLDILSQSTALVLNPRNEIDGLDAAWCKKNLGSTRMAYIVMAQEKANRMRDFFFLASRSFLGTTTNL